MGYAPAPLLRRWAEVYPTPPIYSYHKPVRNLHFGSHEQRWRDRDGTREIEAPDEMPENLASIFDGERQTECQKILHQYIDGETTPGDKAACTGGTMKK